MRRRILDSFAGRAAGAPDRLGRGCENEGCEDGAWGLGLSEGSRDATGWSAMGLQLGKDQGFILDLLCLNAAAI